MGSLDWRCSRAQPGERITSLGETFSFRRSGSLALLLLDANTLGASRSRGPIAGTSRRFGTARSKSMSAKNEIATASAPVHPFTSRSRHCLPDRMISMPFGKGGRFKSMMSVASYKHSTGEQWSGEYEV